MVPRPTNVNVNGSQPAPFSRNIQLLVSIEFLTYTVVVHVHRSLFSCTYNGGGGGGRGGGGRGLGSLGIE